MNTINQKTAKTLIIILSILIPVVVAVLSAVKLKDFGFDVEPLSCLPPIYATFNGITAVCLIFAVWAIKNGNRQLHERLITFAMFLSTCFLAMYVAYHMTAENTKYGGEGLIKIIYYFILITHIILSIVVIPLVLVSYLRAQLGDFEKHKKITKIAFPIWLYVAITGVVVYLMISPYYVH